MVGLVGGQELCIAAVRVEKFQRLKFGWFDATKTPTKNSKQAGKLVGEATKRWGFWRSSRRSFVIVSKNALVPVFSRRDQHPPDFGRSWVCCKKRVNPTRNPREEAALLREKKRPQANPDSSRNAVPISNFDRGNSSLVHRPSEKNVLFADQKERTAHPTMNSRTVMFSTLGQMSAAFETSPSTPQGDDTIPVAFGPASRASKIWWRHQNGQVWGTMLGQYASLHDPPVVPFATDGPGDVFMGTHPNPLNYAPNQVGQQFTKIGFGLPRYANETAPQTSLIPVAINGGAQLNYNSPLPANAAPRGSYSTGTALDLQPRSNASAGVVSNQLAQMLTDSSQLGPARKTSSDYTSLGSYDTSPNRKTIPESCCGGALSGCGAGSCGPRSYGNYDSSPNARSYGENCANYLNDSPYYGTQPRALTCDRSWGTQPQASFGQYPINTYFSGEGASNPMNFRLVPSNTGAVW